MQSAKTLVQQGRSLILQQRFAEAVQVLGQAAQIEPNAKEPLTELGLLCRELGDVDGAIGFFKRAAALDGDDAFVRLNLGLVQYENRMLDDAAASLQDAVSVIDRGVREAQNLMATQTFSNSAAVSAHLETMASSADGARALIEAIAQERAEAAQAADAGTAPGQ